MKFSPLILFITFLPLSHLSSFVVVSFLVFMRFLLSFCAQQLPFCYSMQKKQREEIIIWKVPSIALLADCRTSFFIILPVNILVKFKLHISNTADRQFSQRTIHTPRMYTRVGRKGYGLLASIMQWKEKNYAYFAYDKCIRQLPTMRQWAGSHWNIAKHERKKREMEKLKPKCK